MEPGKSYLIIGSSGKALNAEISPVGGVACIAETEMQTADLGNAGDVIKGSIVRYFGQSRKMRTDSIPFIIKQRKNIFL